MTAVQNDHAPENNKENPPITTYPKDVIERARGFLATEYRRMAQILRDFGEPHRAREREQIANRCLSGVHDHSEDVRAIAAAVTAERERCAQIAESKVDNHWNRTEVLEAIRARRQHVG